MDWAGLLLFYDSVVDSNRATSSLTPRPPGKARRTDAIHDALLSWLKVLVLSRGHTPPRVIVTVR